MSAQLTNISDFGLIVIVTFLILLFPFCKYVFFPLIKYFAKELCEQIVETGNNPTKWKIEALEKKLKQTEDRHVEEIRHLREIYLINLKVGDMYVNELSFHNTVRVYFISPERDLIIGVTDGSEGYVKYVSINPTTQYNNSISYHKAEDLAKKFNLDLETVKQWSYDV